MNLQDFKIYRFRITYTVTRITRFCSYHGTALNGIFGHALMRVSKLAYNSVFRVLAPDSYEHKRKLPVLPAPFVIKPALASKEIYFAGEDYVFDLLLIGSAIEQLSEVLLALVEVEKMSVGERTGSRRGHLKLKSVDYYTTATTTESFISTTQVEALDVEASTIEASVFACEKTTPDADSTIETSVPAGKKTDRLILNFVTPVDFGKCDLPQLLPFSLVVQRMIQRLELLTRFYQHTQLIDPTEIEQWQQTAETIQTTVCCFAARTVIHSRIKKYEAWLGAAGYKGVPDMYIPLLRLYEQLHIGSHTTCGMGEFRLVI